MISLLTFLVILSVLIMVHELGHFLAAKKLGVKVETFSLGFGAVMFKKKHKGTEYCVSAIPLGGYVKMAGDSAEEFQGKRYEYFSQAPGKRFYIIFCGPLLNYVLGFLCFWLIFSTGYPTLSAKVGGTLDGYGAQAAGIRQGDVIFGVDGHSVSNWPQLQKLIQAHKDAAPARLSVFRQGVTFPVEVNVKTRDMDDAIGGKRSVGLLGITPAYDEVITERHAPGEAFILAVRETGELTVLTYKGLWRLITGKLSMRESMTGPLGIFMITSEAAQVGLNALLHLIAVLNISLALFNLLPLPILDGGHIVLLGVERLRGKMLNAKVEGIITQVGMTFIVSLALLVTYNDIVRIFGKMFH